MEQNNSNMEACCELLGTKSFWQLLGIFLVNIYIFMTLIGSSVVKEGVKYQMLDIHDESIMRLIYSVLGGFVVTSIIVADAYKYSFFKEGENTNHLKSIQEVNDNCIVHPLRM